MNSEWTKEEIAILKDLYQSSDYLIEEISEALPGRSENAIRIKAHRLGFERPPQIQLETYGNTCPLCGALLNKTNQE